MDRIRILVADDHRQFREGIRAMLRREAELELVGEVATGAEAISAAETLQPDVILMDLHMPDVNGIEATRRILETSPHIRILVLTMFEDDDSVFAALRPEPAVTAFPELTDREREVVALIAQGWSNSEIAARLVVSLKTVRNYVSNIFSKLHVADRTEAILRARNAGLGQSDTTGSTTAEGV
jgi:DNA-binding NarL/FixJ family response regulator